MAEALQQKLYSLHEKGYGAYQSLAGSWHFPSFDLHIDRAPKDPFAPPFSGVFRVSVPTAKAGFPDASFATRNAAIAFRDFLARRFHHACKRFSRGRRGTGNSGIITIAEPGQEILDRSSVKVDRDTIEARFFLGLPAHGRSIDARLAHTMIFSELPAIVESSLFASAGDLCALERHLHASEDADALRKKLSELGLVAFIADGSILPRASGIDPRPLQSDNAVPFSSPETLRIVIDLPHAGSVTGMRVPKGVTLLVGGGYHGKSTLLQAIESGIYNHIPGDGRELCVTVSTAVKIRASSGRSVTSTDISAFINHLPLARDTVAFSTTNASGSTSQAAFVAESLEAGAQVLLMDEDTSAANFMIRDGRMQQLVAREHEPITAFVDRVRQLYDELGVSTILVMGGSGDYFDVADCVIQLRDFRPEDVTASARNIVRTSPSRRAYEGSARLAQPRSRILHRLPVTADPQRHLRISAPDVHQLILGKNVIDLSDVEQLKETAQTRAIGYALRHADKYVDGRTTLGEIIEKVMAEARDLDVLDPRRTGHLASFRGLDLAAAINRIRGVDLRQE